MSLAVPGTDIVFAWPWALLALALPWLARRLLPPRRAHRRPALRVPDAERFIATAREGTGRRGRPDLLLVAFWIALTLALMRPQALGEPIRVEPSGRDLMLAIDISGSMAEQDLYAGNRRATRMEVVREVAKRFVERRAGDRIGLVMFGTEAYVQTPLTTDHASVQHFLDEASVGLARRDTAIGDAIGLSVKRLRETTGDLRVLILLTDGENSAGVVTPLEAAGVAAESGVRIHTIGVGSESRGAMAGLRRPQIDEGTLQRISAATGGRFFRARSSEELEAIYAAIDEIEPSAGEPEPLRPVVELQSWPLGAALLLSFAWAGLRAGGRSA